MKRIIITTGDGDGIGLEITAKALLRLGPHQKIQYIFWTQKNPNKKFINLIKKKFKIIQAPSLSDALKLKKNKNTILHIQSNKNPALWFEESVRAAKSGKVHALVTGPLAKSTIKKSGLKDAGHTDIMRRCLKNNNVQMAFYGEALSLVLFSDHIAYKEVPKRLTKKALLKTILTAYDFVKLTQPKNKKIGVLGLNPHAGELKQLGIEEKKIIIPAIRAAQKLKIPVSGPLIPDICFQPHLNNKYGVFVALYHDQGLIPFKLLHYNHSGIQVSLNLPFVRTSVDHGTAKDIFNKNIADPNSMILALRKAIQWC